ncbi:AraC family transcriptional regulator [Bacillus sp. APMAM]|nr:AraC family transcriptional regulator [Bacillus sp. APMAM]RTZ56177.1 AraC family transcriptional regulator [Bacillus sp. SAJ1]
MRYLDGIQIAIDYIEDNLKNRILLKDISKIVGYSMYHFHRIFQSCVKESVTEYIRRRRLTKAAYDILYTNARIIDIALEYQFETHESFTRAFTKMFHITPGLYRKNKQRILIREKQRITEQNLLYLYGGIAMEPKIVVKDPFTVIGLTCSTTLTESKVPALWEEFLTRVNEIKDKVSPNVMMGISEFSTNHIDGAFTYIACVPVHHTDFIPEGMVCKSIPKREYVVVTHKGKLDELGHAFDFIYGSWLPKSGYDLEEADDFEIYDERFKGADNEDSQVDIYIPIRKTINKLPL